MEQTVFVRTLLREIIDSLNPPQDFGIELPFYPARARHQRRAAAAGTSASSNALKYRPPPPAPWRLAARDAEFYLFSVADDGPDVRRNT
jgi:hypothetical protein